jgi:hypothetical protein
MQHSQPTTLLPIQSNTKLLPKSLAIIMEVKLKEMSLKFPTTPCLERTDLAFTLFKELIPLLGIHTHIATLILSELEQSIFTNENQFTGFGDGRLQAIPYFTMIDRIDRI